MRGVMAVAGLMLLSGCGSCLEDKKVPEVEQTTPTIKTVTKRMEGGTTRPVLVGDSVNLADLMKHDASADSGH